jgi:hypothetical protein
LGKIVPKSSDFEFFFFPLKLPYLDIGSKQSAKIYKWILKCKVKSLSLRNEMKLFINFFFPSWYHHRYLTGTHRVHMRNKKTLDLRAFQKTEGSFCGHFVFWNAHVSFYTLAL